jgi:hypothetical protein
MDKLYLYAFANLAMSFTSMFICICRLNSMNRKTTLLRVRVEYALGAGVLFASGLAPLVGEWPGVIWLGLTFYVLATLLASSHAWRHDRPPAVASQVGELRRADGSAL